MYEKKVYHGRDMNFSITSRRSACLTQAVAVPVPRPASALLVCLAYGWYLARTLW